MVAGRHRAGDATGASPSSQSIPLVSGLLAAQNADGGWPYRRGTSWTEPTALALLALRKAARESQGDELQARIESGCAYLLAHRCSDGGWNHGSSRALGYESNSYPETTGIALLALEGVPKLDGSLSTAERQLRNCR